MKTKRIEIRRGNDFRDAEHAARTSAGAELADPNLVAFFDREENISAPLETCDEEGSPYPADWGIAPGKWPCGTRAGARRTAIALLRKTRFHHSKAPMSGSLRVWQWKSRGALAVACPAPTSGELPAAGARSPAAGAA